MEGFDRAGNRLDAAASTVGPSMASVVPASLIRAGTEGSAPSEIVLSEQSRQALGYVHPTVAEHASGGGEPDWYRDPIAHEPLDLFVREALAGLADAEGSSCVAVDVADGLWSVVRSCAAQGWVRCDVLTRALEGWTPYERATGAGFVVWRPRDPEIEDLVRADRKALARFAQTVPRAGFAALRRIARLYHDASASPGILTEVWYPESHTFTSAGTAHLPGRVCALLGGINDSDWERLTEGATLTLGGLGLGREAQAVLEHPDLPVGGLSAVPDIDQHPMELFPQGDLSGIPISLGTSTVPMLRDWPENTKEGDFWSSQDDLRDVLRVPPTYFRPADDDVVTHLTRAEYEARLGRLMFRTGKRVDLALTLGLPKGLSLRCALSGAVTPDGEPFRYADLSESTRAMNWSKAVEDGKKEARERWKAASRNPSDVPSASARP